MEKEDFQEKYSICTATQEDIPKLVGMRLKLQEHMERANNLILQYTDEWRYELPLLYKDLLKNSNVVILKAVSKQVDEVVGMMVGTIHEHSHFTIEKSAKIDDVWVDNEHRKKGICSQMLLYLRDRLTEKGIEHLTLNFVVNNIEAERAWRALGFTPTIMNCVAKMKD